MKKILLISLLLSLNSWAKSTGELTLHFIPSPHGMDWSSPSSVALSALKNKLSLKDRFIGHVFVDLKCGDSHELTGMTGKEFDYLNQLLIERKGLGILFHSFQGTLEEKEKIIPELTEFQKTGFSNFITFLLNDSQCARLTTYMNEYRKNDVGRYYGLANRPRFGEGAGCSAFGVSFPDVLGILDQDMKESWSQTVRIPLAFSGPPLQEEGVNLLTIMLNAGSWAKDEEKHQKLTFWDPDKMHQWVKNKVQLKQSNYSIKKIENAEGVVFDKTHFPTPLEPIWLQQIDPKTKTLVGP